MGHHLVADFPMNSKRLSVQDFKSLFFSLKGFVLGGNALDFGWFPVQFPSFVLPLCCSTSLPERQRNFIARRLWLMDFACGKPLGFHWGSHGPTKWARGPKSCIFRGLRTFIHTELTEIWGVSPKLPKSPAYSLARRFPYWYLGQIGVTDDVIIGPLINE